MYRPIATTFLHTSRQWRCRDVCKNLLWLTGEIFKAEYCDVAHLPGNSIRHKFYEIYVILNGNRIDIFGISEAAITASFINAKCDTPGFQLYRQDRDIRSNGGGIMVYIEGHIFLIAYCVSTRTQKCCFINVVWDLIWKCTWLLVYVHKPPKVSDDSIWNILCNLAHCFVSKGNVIAFFGNIKTDMFKDNVLCDLCDIYEL